MSDRVFSKPEARASLSQLLTEASVSEREVVIQRKKPPIAVIIGYQKYLELQRQRGERAARES